MHSSLPLGTRSSHAPALALRRVKYQHNAESRRTACPPVRAEQGDGPGGSGGKTSLLERIGGAMGFGDALGPIGLTVGSDIKRDEVPPPENEKEEVKQEGVLGKIAEKAQISMGPISLTFSDDLGRKEKSEEMVEGEEGEWDVASHSGRYGKSIASMTTEEWRAMYENPDGTVSLWVKEEFNAASRLVGGRVVHNGGVAGFRSGEGPSAGTAPRHSVTIVNHHAGQEVEVEIPEDRYILWEAEDKGLMLPWACRMGCCTSCAVKVKEGEVEQRQALGVSKEFKEQGYALMCVAYPKTDCVLETVEEDEVYDLQFGQYFARQALDPNNPNNIERDDFALEFANMDE